MRAPRALAPRPHRHASPVGARGLLTVLAALECEVAGLPDWVLMTSEEEARVPAATAAAVPASGVVASHAVPAGDRVTPGR